MNLLLTDTPLTRPFEENETNHYIDLSQLHIKNCMGCFSCWVKTPGKCILRDDAVKVYPIIAKSSRVLYVSRICFGSYDTTMKTMLERAIPIQQAFIRLHNGQTHHVQRDVVQKDAVIIGYGDISKEDQNVFQKLVARNADNMQFKTWNIHFVSQDGLDAAVKREVEAWQNCSL